MHYPPTVVLESANKCIMQNWDAIISIALISTTIRILENL